MDEEIALSLIHEDGEDQYISTRRPASQAASFFTQQLEKNTANWSLKSRKQFNIKLRRFGARNPEALASSRSLAQATERLVILNRLKAHCPKLRTWNHKAATEAKVVGRLPEEKESEVVVVSEPGIEDILFAKPFKKMLGLQGAYISWNNEAQAVFDEAVTNLQAFIREVMMGIHHMALSQRRLHNRKNRVIQVDETVVQRFLESFGAVTPKETTVFEDSQNEAPTTPQAHYGPEESV